MHTERKQIVVVPRFTPDHIGHGGVHRSYQLHHDLCQVIGLENVLLFQPNAISRQSKSSSLIRVPYRFRKTVQRFNGIRENPFAIVHNSEYSRSLGAGSALINQVINEYLYQIETWKPKLVLIEDPAFSRLLQINKQHGIKTIACFQNLESLDRATPSDRGWFLSGTALDLFHELRILSECDERLFISKVEAGLIGGLGLSAVHYPYQPVGLIAESLDRVRETRLSSEVQRNEFLLLGSAGHTTTGEGMRWFVDQVTTHGLPKPIEIIVAGNKSDKLFEGRKIPTGVSIKGWIDQDELDEILTRVSGVLIPQWRGFGALTKIAELRYAGIPLIVSKHALMAVDGDDGIIGVDPDWEQWVDAMIRCGSVDASVPQMHSTTGLSTSSVLQQTIHRIIGTYGNATSSAQ